MTAHLETQDCPRICLFWRFMPSLLEPVDLLLDLLQAGVRSFLEVTSE